MHSFKISDKTRAQMNRALKHCTEEQRVALLDAFAQYLAEAQIYVTTQVMRQFHEEVSGVLGKMLEMPKRTVRPMSQAELTALSAQRRRR